MAELTAKPSKVAGGGTEKLSDVFERMADVAERKAQLMLYDWAGTEYEHGRKQRGLWYAAYSEAGGDENRALALYLERRVDALWEDYEDWLDEDDEEVEAQDANGFDVVLVGLIALVMLAFILG